VPCTGKFQYKVTSNHRREIGEPASGLQVQVGDNATGPGPRFSGVGDRGGFGAMLESAALIGPIVPLCGGALSEYPARATASDDPPCLTLT
jgi:hypothetical protein